jgi:hypothetical protein
MLSIPGNPPKLFNTINDNKKKKKIRKKKKKTINDLNK